MSTTNLNLFKQVQMLTTGVVGGNVGGYEIINERIGNDPRE